MRRAGSRRSRRRRRACSADGERDGMVRSWPRKVTRRVKRLLPLVLLLLAARRVRPRLRRLVVPRAAAPSSRCRATSAPSRCATRRAQDDPRRRDGDAPAAAQVHVKTRYGGGFVQEIDGLGGGRATGGRSTGSSTSTGSRRRRRGGAQARRAGDHVWWDHHDWGAASASRRSSARSRSRSRSAARGKKIPIRIDCADDAVRECHEVGKRLEDAGAMVGGTGTVGSRTGPEVMRLLVGRWAEVRARPERARGSSRGPKVSRRVRAAVRGRRRDRAARLATARRCATLGAGLGARRGDALPRPAADLGGHRHRHGRRRGGGRRARRGPAEGSLRGGDRERAGGPAPAAGRRDDGAVTYRRRASPLHAARAGVASLYCVVLAGVALSFEHPLILSRAAGGGARRRGGRAGGRAGARARCCGGCRSRW